MTAILVAVVVLLVLAVAALATPRLRRRPAGRSHPVPPAADDGRRILFPFMASALSVRALDAALRLARAEEAVLVPVFLARVPLTMPLDAPLPRQAGIAIELQDAIEQRAATFGIAVDARVERGRTHRHALRRAIATEHCHRIVVAAATRGGAAGFGPDDVAWLLEHAAGEIVVLRPGAEDVLVPAAPRPAGASVRRRPEPAARAHAGVTP
jgi:hypothetical protein